MLLSCFQLPVVVVLLVPLIECRLGRCENIKSLKIYFPQMILGVCHKNKTLLPKENISKVQRL